MVMVGRSVHLTTLFLGKLVNAVNQYFVHILSLVTENNVIFSDLFSYVSNQKI